MSGNRGATKRTPDQIKQDRARIAELMQQGKRPARIAEIIRDEKGYTLTPTQIASDTKAIRENWLTRQEINYNALFMQEQTRLDALEQELWDQFHASASPKMRRTIEGLARNGVIDNSAAQKIIETQEIGGKDTKWVDLIIRVQQERRKLWGLYAPERKQVHSEVVIKGYKIVSPSDWDEPEDADIIEGEVMADSLEELLELPESIDGEEGQTAEEEN